MSRVPVFLVSLMCLGGCADWPNFDYEALPDVLITEVETGQDVAQSIGYLRSRIIVDGSIEGGGTRPSDLIEEGGYWYTNDVDYYAFGVSQTIEVQGSLTWDNPETELDALLVVYDPETSSFGEVLSFENDQGDTAHTFDQPFLSPGDTYLMIIGSQGGPPSPYQLTLEVTDTL